MNNNITPLEFLYSAFYYKEDVERMVLADTPSVYAEQFKQALFNAGFQVADFHYEVASQAIDAILDFCSTIEEVQELHIATLEDNSYIEADPYTTQLTSWASSFESLHYLNEALQDCGTFSQYTDLLAFAQYNHKRDIYELTLTAVQEFLSLNA